MMFLDRSKNSVFLLFLIVWGLILPGCMSLKKSYPDIKTYSLQADVVTASGYAGKVISVHLNPLSAAPQFADRYLTYRVADSRYESDFYNQFMASPAVMIEGQTQIWLEKSPVIEFVLPTEGALNPYFLIDGKVLEFYGDYRKSDDPKAILKMEWTVSRLDSAGTEVLFQKLYAEELSIAWTSPRLLVEGWNKAMVKILSEFEGDLKILAEQPKKK